MHERYIRWWTPWLSREMEMLVFGHGSGLPLILFPTSLGRYHQNKDFGLVGSIAGWINAGRVTVYCPDSIDASSWYNRGIHPADRIRTHQAYENMIVHDVFDLARRQCSSHRVALAGASFGAYHAVNTAFRHPDAVSHLFSLSGAFDIKQFLDGWYGDSAYFHNPPDYLDGCRDPWKYGHMSIVLGTGEWDSCRGENLRLSGILNGKGVRHFLDDRRWCGHDWNWWREMLPYYLSIS